MVTSINNTDLSYAVYLFITCVTDLNHRDHFSLYETHWQSGEICLFAFAILVKKDTKWWVSMLTATSATFAVIVINFKV